MRKYFLMKRNNLDINFQNIDSYSESINWFEVNPILQVNRHSTWINNYLQKVNLKWIPLY